LIGGDLIKSGNAHFWTYRQTPPAEIISTARTIKRIQQSAARPSGNKFNVMPSTANSLFVRVKRADAASPTPVKCSTGATTMP